MKDLFKSKITRIIFGFLVSILIFTGCGGSGGSSIESRYIETMKNDGCLKIDSEFITITGVEKSYHYEGVPIEPKPTIKLFNGNSYKEGTDYDLSYSYDGENGTINIIGKKNICSGTINFKIQYDKTDISIAEVTGIKKAYTLGDTIDLENITVKVNGVVLMNRVDYTYNINGDTLKSGVVTIEISGFGNYTGYKYITTNIIDKPVITCADPTPIYNGSEQKIATCTNGKISNEVVVAAGSYDVVCKAELYDEIIEEVSTTVQCKIEPADISLVAEIVESGDSEIPKDRIRVRLNSDGSYLVVDRDYQLVSKLDNNTYTIYVRGINNYKGEISYKYVNGINIADATIEMSRNVRYAIKAGTLFDKKNGKEGSDYYEIVDGKIVPKTGYGPKVILDGKVLELEKDYLIEYSNNNAPGLAIANITGIGEYTGTKTGGAFYIVRSTCSDASQASEADVVYEGVDANDKHNLANKKIVDNLPVYYVELEPGETLNVKVTIPSICGKIIRRNTTGDGRVDRHYSNDTLSKSWSDYLTIVYTDIEYDSDGKQMKNNSGKPVPKEVEYDENGNVTHLIKITAKDIAESEIPKKKTENWVGKIKSYRTYMTYMDDSGREQEINYSGATIIVTIVPKGTTKIVDEIDKGEDPVCGKVDNESRIWRHPTQEICVHCATCKQEKYCKTYDGDGQGIHTHNDDGKIYDGTRTVQGGFVTIEGTNGVKKDCKFSAYVTQDDKLINANKSTPTPTPTATPKPTATSTQKADCCCLDNMSYDKCYIAASNGICEKGSHAASADKCETITYTCVIGYDEKTNILSITGKASYYGRTDSLKTVLPTSGKIDGKDPGEITVTSKTYKGTVHFSNGKTAECQRTIKLAQEEKSKCCCKDGVSCVWTTKECSSIDRSEAKYSKEDCQSRGTTEPECGTVYEDRGSTWNYNIDWTTGSSKKICVTCKGCSKIKNCTTYYANNKDIEKGSITVTGLNGKTKTCSVDVKLKAKVTGVCCCNSNGCSWYKLSECPSGASYEEVKGATSNTCASYSSKYRNN